MGNCSKKQPVLPQKAESENESNEEELSNDEIPAKSSELSADQTPPKLSAPSYLETLKSSATWKKEPVAGNSGFAESLADLLQSQTFISDTHCLLINAIPRRRSPSLPGDDIFEHPFTLGPLGLQGAKSGQAGCFLLYSQLNEGSLFIQWTSKPPSSEEALAFGAPHSSKIPVQKFTGSKVELCRQIMSKPENILNGWVSFLKTCYRSGLAVAFLPKISKCPFPKVMFVFHGIAESTNGDEDHKVRVVDPSEDPPVVLRGQRIGIVFNEGDQHKLPFTQGQKVEEEEFDTQILPLGEVASFVT